MGLGLDIQTEGHHLVFCAGTGCLVYLDLVAHIILDICTRSSKDRIFKDSFKLTFYLSAPSEEHAIGLTLLQYAEAVSNHLKLDIFELKLRLSTMKNVPRWNEKFIEDQLTPLAGNIRKLYVCGSPAMNECFDRTLETLAPHIGLSWLDIDIM